MAPIPAPILAMLRQIEPESQISFRLDGFCARSSAGPCYYVKMGIPENTEQYQGVQSCILMAHELISMSR